MRDDTPVRSLSVRGGCITAFFVFLLLLIAGGALGVWGGIRYWKKYNVLSDLHKQQERELLEAKLQLERYVNYEILLEASNNAAPVAKNEEIGTAAPLVRPHNATQESSSFAARNGTRPSAGLHAKNGGNATMPLYNASLPVTPEASVDASSLPLVSSETSPLRINGFVGRVVSSQRLRVRYELSAIPAEEQRAVSGTASYVAVLHDGTEAELAVQDVGDSRFALLRMKPMEGSLRIPPQTAVNDINKIQVILKIDGGKAFKENFPLTR
ncbi:MAG: hypothetical protein LBD42_09325 [Desulfovibrio sp.]|nr:hypothetical protein [Desulfovibrio sp.]